MPCLTLWNGKPGWLPSRKNVIKLQQDLGAALQTDPNSVQLHILDARYSVVFRDQGALETPEAHGVHGLLELHDRPEAQLKKAANAIADFLAREVCLIGMDITIPSKSGLRFANDLGLVPLPKKPRRRRKTKKK